jgi:hypothetical protein
MTLGERYWMYKTTAAIILDISFNVAKKACLVMGVYLASLIYLGSLIYLRLKCSGFWVHGKRKCDVSMQHVPHTKLCALPLLPR